MIDLKLLEKSYREFTDKTDTSSENFYVRYKKIVEGRKMDPSSVDQLLDANKVRREAIQNVESQKAEQNKVGQSIAMKKRNKEDATKELEEMQKVSASIKTSQEKLVEAEAKVDEILFVMPNICDSSVPFGKDENENREEKKVGEPRKFDFKPLTHDEMGEKSGDIDFERAGKVAGARFAFLNNEAALLERKLVNFMLDMHTKDHGYREIVPPYMANSKSFFGVGQFPKFKEDVFHLENTDYYLIPTAEVPLTNYFAEEILPESQLPQKFTAFSPCFRSEAGSYGRDTKGLIRQHQFHKVELVTLCHPDKSYEEHEYLTSCAEKILEALELPYRRTTLCTGDISLGAAKCYDLEVWLPGQNAYREISSCSNFEDFQARRANIRFRPDGPKAKPQFVHTLNGSGLAIGRTLVAVLENYQNEDGSFEWPKALK